MGKVIAFVKNNKGLLAFTAIAAVFVVALNHYVNPSRSGHVSSIGDPATTGTAEHPKSMHVGWRSDWDESSPMTSFWRATTVREILEAPVADGYAPGRCLVALGRVYGGAGDNYDDSEKDNRPPLILTYGANRDLLEEGDAEAACSASAIVEALAQSGNYGYSEYYDARPLAEVALTSHENPNRERMFVQVTYLPGDVEPDVVVLTEQTPVAGERIPEPSAVFAFRLVSPIVDPALPGPTVDAIFGLSHLREGGE